jgi:hypothetical protein
LLINLTLLLSDNRAGVGIGVGNTFFLRQKIKKSAKELDHNDILNILLHLMNL